MSLALVEYRRGQYAEAVRWGSRCLTVKQVPAMERVAAAQAILAMAYHKLGEAEQARATLRKSRELVEERWKSPFTANDNSRGWWYDWRAARILEAEAAGVLEAQPVSKK
jgi:hypothetical protein